LDPRFAGSNLVEDDGFLRAIKISSTSSFGGEVKPSAPSRKILRNVKKPFEVEAKTLHNAKFIIYFASSSCFANRCSTGRTAKELW
jgi:hypothetical protein